MTINEILKYIPRDAWDMPILVEGCEPELITLSNQHIAVNLGYGNIVATYKRLFDTEPYDKNTIIKINDIIDNDLFSINPEYGVMKKCQHQAILDWGGCEKENYVDFTCDIATRYYEDENYARAYALTPYGSGVAIFADKKEDRYTLFMLGEDDGAWFVSTVHYLAWVNYSNKLTFVSLISEALSIFNANYKYELANR